MFKIVFTLFLVLVDKLPNLNDLTNFLLAFSTLLDSLHKWFV
jgi:hypothetical protein